MKTKTSHIARLRKQYASNQAYILDNVTLTEKEYLDAKFEIGCLFLERMFPENTEYAHLYEAYAYCKSFWNWWKQEWNDYESGLVLFINDHKPTFFYKQWYAEMLPMAHDTNIEMGFESYVKTLAYG